MDRFSLRAKLVGAFVVIALITLLVGFFGWSGISGVRGNLEKITDINLPGTVGLYKIIEGQETVKASNRTLLIPGLENDLVTAQFENVKKGMQIFDEGRKTFDSLTMTSEEAQVWTQCESILLEWEKAVNDFGIIMKEYQQTGYKATYDNAKVFTEHTLMVLAKNSKDLLDKLVDINANVVKSTKTKAQSDANIALWVAIFGTVMGTLLALAFGIFLSLSISRSIKGIINNLNESTQQVAGASNQLSVTSQQLSDASSEQAASIEETSATLEESSSMVHQNNENTKQAAVLAGQAKAAADKGNNQMQEMMNSINEIKKSSDHISKIIKVIDEIAFQTNILALNAAVEAARAGDAGMGFAVVAEEVRNLAQRSAQAAKDTAVIIENNIELSKKGVETAEMVGDSLDEITGQAKKVNELMGEIAAASQEQAQGITQISKAIIQMEKVTQQNAATSEESAAAAEELNTQSEQLREIVLDLTRLVEGSGNSNGIRYLK
ncbi:MAG: methyl-accepting chemotaxis protein [Clostridia bacterium]|nr:methyl-accepting chemotaxis protein [Clostridia bacterium]